MDIGMSLPHLIPFSSRKSLIEWCGRIETGPYSTLAVGERVTYDNLDQSVALAAAAVLTSRPKIFFGLTVLPQYPAASVAKRVASVDVLSEGRVVLGVGAGGRRDDYALLEREMAGRLPLMDRQVDDLRKAWRGEPLIDGVAPVGPLPIQPNGPPIYASARGPKSLARAARWADGNFGGSAGADGGIVEVATLVQEADRVKAAWRDAGRATTPYLVNSVWFALGQNGAEDTLKAGRRYFATGGLEQSFEFNLAMAPSYDADRFRATLDAFEAAGWDEVVLVPTTTDIRELDRLETLLATR